MCTVLIKVHLTGRDKHYCGSGSPEQGSRFCLAQLLESEATNPFEYEFSFHLEIRGPCLLAGRSTGAVLLRQAGLSPPQGNVHALPPLPPRWGVCFGKLTVLGLTLTWGVDRAEASHSPLGSCPLPSCYLFSLVLPVLSP